MTTFLQRMRYNEYLAAGSPIASGLIEGACRHVAKDRRERSGTRWTTDGARADARRSTSGDDQRLCFRPTESTQKPNGSIPNIDDYNNFRSDSPHSGTPVTPTTYGAVFGGARQAVLEGWPGVLYMLSLALAVADDFAADHVDDVLGNVGSEVGDPLQGARNSQQT